MTRLDEEPLSITRGETSKDLSLSPAAPIDSVKKAEEKRLGGWGFQNAADRDTHSQKDTHSQGAG